jgi:hypothetical protein
MDTVHGFVGTIWDTKRGDRTVEILTDTVLHGTRRYLIESLTTGRRHTINADVLHTRYRRRVNEL